MTSQPLGQAAVSDLLRQAAAVCLDVDSTVCTDEGIDKLAELCGAAERVREWTTKAMTGNISFQDAFQARLELMKPTTHQIATQVALGISLTPGVEAFVRRLHERNVSVYLLTGGIRPLVQPVAEALSIPSGNVFANVLLHDDEGRYLDFDRSQPTSHTGGKREAVEQIKQQHGGKTVIMIGDGVTDMEARPPADAFIGFGGNVVRDKVKAGCDWFVHSFGELLAVLNE